ncbi:MAG: hypothetical protein GEV28_31015 [Actinophytocola sp.]|uniref:hypothetical protein n=1 Tax=Actinophytocola sp. TaxID=1872138 RepID=UPI0013280713|nr:hypothetical protein [Actinophytocola sp.]MPZ84581.1 hypothetical protein [Actinophytocola sp.]
MATVRSLSSRWLAICCAVVYLVVSAVLGAALLIRPEVPAAAGPAASIPTYVSEDSRGDTTTGATTSPPPHGFQRVSGPARVQTVIPVGWTIARAGGPGAMRATDPSDSGRFVSYGGATATSRDIAGVHLAYETKFAERTAEYERIGLNHATYAGHQAIEWEYEHNDGSGTQHVRSLFWLVDGVEYFIFASGPQARWPGMLPIYDEMVANSRP